MATVEDKTSRIVAGRWNVSRDEYDADLLHLRSSALKEFAVSRPLYHGRYVTRELAGRDSTDAMEQGTAFHAAVLEPDRFSELVSIKPDRAKRSNVDKEFWLDWEHEHRGKCWITEEQYETVRRMSDSVRRHPQARKLLDRQGRNEQAIHWQDETGVACKALFDRWSVNLIGDLKSANDPYEGWIAQAARLKYHWQSAFYMRGLNAMGYTGRFIFIVTGNKPPFETFAHIFSDRTMRSASIEVERLLKELAECQQSGDWSSRDGGAITCIDLPKWALVEEATR